MKVRVLLGGSGAFRQYPEGRWGGFVERDVHGRQDPSFCEAVLGKFSPAGLAAAVSEAMRKGTPAPGLRGGAIVDVEI